MPVTKAFDQKSSRCTVTFTLPLEAAGNAKKLFLAGEFNGWSPSELPMRKGKGTFSVSLELETERQYQYRFVTEAGVWLNDTQADFYVYNAFADSDNSVVAL